MLPFGASARDDGLTRVTETVVAVRIDDDPLGRQAADGCIAGARRSAVGLVDERDHPAVQVVRLSPRPLAIRKLELVAYARRHLLDALVDAVHLAERGAGDEEAHRGLAHVAVAALPAAAASVRLHRPRTHRHLRCCQPQAQTQAMQPQHSAPLPSLLLREPAQGTSSVCRDRDRLWFPVWRALETVTQTLSNLVC